MTPWPIFERLRKHAARAQCVTTLMRAIVPGQSCAASGLAQDLLYVDDQNSGVHERPFFLNYMVIPLVD
ncbi:hypothetical protein B9Z37_13905 [Limnohabitans parvus II-B4]|uniref:Uncharacterized protein n=1 Tax=Limnohabitans parvus II-B4 TaxID=1293052 RepID=A0A315E6G8_9BURK|nr:hypothetical protein B9Z37_13905 [Limnohabitans parvus II-B4]